MYSDYFSVHRDELSQKREKKDVFRNDTIMNDEDNRQKAIEVSEEKLANVADRALLLLSFKDTQTQNLRHVMKILGIQTLEEKKHILKIIFRLIQEGTVYIPRGIGTLIDTRFQFDLDSPIDNENIDLCLLKPYDQLIEGLRKEILELQEEDEKIK
jgi:hypothetical protein